MELRNSLNPPEAEELLRPADTLGREADIGMVGTEMLAPPATDDWLLLENDVGKLEGGGDDKQLWTAGEPQNHNECLSSSSVLSLSQLNLSALLFHFFTVQREEIFCNPSSDLLT